MLPYHAKHQYIFGIDKKSISDISPWQWKNLGKMVKAKTEEWKMKGGGLLLTFGPDEPVRVYLVEPDLEKMEPGEKAKFDINGISFTFGKKQ